MQHVKLLQIRHRHRRRRRQYYLAVGAAGLA
jgi:hypothetical protein